MICSPERKHLKTRERGEFDLKYPAVIRKINGALALVAGFLIFLIGAFAVYEAVVRLVYEPTKWTLNLSTYMLIYIVFLGSPYAFETHGHVFVDLFRDIMDKHSKKRLPRRISAVAGYCLSIIFIATLLYASWKLVAKALKFGTLTTTTIPIPIWILQIVMVIGCILMLVTLVFIILDILSGSEEFI